MTVSSLNLKDIYDGDGSTRDWPITFPISGLRESDIAFYVTDENGASKLTTNGVEVDLSTPKVIYPTVASGLDVIPATEGCVVLRKLALVQESIDVATQGAIPLPSIEAGFDRGTLVDQQLQEQIDRCVKVDLTETTPDTLIASIQAAAADAAVSAGEAESSASTAASSASAAQSSASNASDSADAAEAAAATLNFPAISTGDAGKRVIINSTDDGYEYEEIIAPPEGISEYDSSTEYNQYSIVKKAGTYELYGSKIDSNTGNALPSAVDDTNWKYLGDLVDLIDAAFTPAVVKQLLTDSVSSASTSSTSYTDIGADVDITPNDGSNYILVMMTGTIIPDSIDVLGSVALQLDSGPEVSVEEARYRSGGGGDDAPFCCFHIFQAGGTSAINISGRYKTSGSNTAVRAVKLNVFEL